MLGVAAAVGIPILLHRASHPKRELRYSIVQVDRTAGTWRVLVWSAARADIPSALYDSDLPIVFRFDPPVSAGAVRTNLAGTPQ